MVCGTRLAVCERMRLVMAAGILALAGRAASAAYVVELDAGEPMTVDSYWAEGDHMHLMRQGVDLSVPRGRIRNIHEAEGSSVVEGRPAARSTSAKPTSSNREELEAREAGITRHLLRVQQERFEARARGESPARLNHLDGEFRRAQRRRVDALHALDQLEPAK